MATKEHRRSARGLIEALEARVHSGPPIGATEIASALSFLQQCSFSPASDYFSRLTQIQHRVATRISQPTRAPGKRNYGGEAGGRWMQVQSVYDHVILSTCYAGEFNTQRGRVKLSHRFNREGRIDFVELKFLRAMTPWLTGEVRKLVLVKDFKSARQNWHETEAFTLRVLPQELIFLYPEIFRCDKNDVLAWVINIGHRLTNDLTTDLNSGIVRRAEQDSSETQNQSPLEEVRDDEVALPILEKAATLESAVELSDEQSVIVRYHRL